MPNANSLPLSRIPTELLLQPEQLLQLILFTENEWVRHGNEMSPLVRLHVRQRVNHHAALTPRIVCTVSFIQYTKQNKTSL